MRALVSLIAAALGLAAILPAQTEPQTGWGELNGRLIRYQVRGGFAVAQGDIILGTAGQADAVPRSSLRQQAGPLASVLTFTGGAQKWPNATMAYVIDTNIPTPQRIVDAIAH